MSYDDDDNETGGSTYDYPFRRDDVYGQHARPPYQPQATTTIRPMQASLKPPPQSANRASLIDDDSDENDEQDDHPRRNIRRPGRGGFDGTAAIRGDVADFSSQPQSSSSSLGIHVVPSTSRMPSLTASMDDRKRTIPGINHGMEISPDDYGMMPHPNDFLPEQPVRQLGRTARTDVDMDKKVPSTRNIYQAKDPPTEQRSSAPVDFSDSIARLTAQIDQPDEETLMTQHAQQTLMEIQKTRVGGEIIANHPANSDVPHLTRSNLPNLSEPRKQVSTIFFKRIQKPLEPNTKSTHLRRPPIRETTVDVMVGLPSSNVTTLDQRIACLSCGESLVTAKGAIVVLCPKCGDAHPNHRVIAQEEDDSNSVVYH